ncbi:MAG TPA: TAT-variant-translocated molybdopterin oxidoreductase [Candidatus Acidoferrales bacterium]|nr:TAT-variant-translocated molybdopterin oxidoreductase [Candidatus Acidoferrales bacterium]
MSSNANAPDPNSVDLAAVRAKLAETGKNHFWQSLEELSETKEYRDFFEHEFPHETAKNPEGIDRRDVLKLAAASAALAGLSACTKLPTEKIVPYVRPPEEIIPGKPLFYATSMQLAGVAAGLLVESNMGRPTKIEGNPEHPGSLGGTDVFSQASILTLYDPDRSQTVIHEGRISDWGAFAAAIADVRGQQSPKGAGLRILTETVTSPSLTAQMRDILAQFPQAKWHQYEQCGRDNVRAGAKLAFGKPVNPVYRLDKADVIVSLDADFLTSGAGHVRYARDFSSRRSMETPSSNPNRLYVVECMPTSTGAMADHRKPVRASEIAGFAAHLASELGIGSATGASASVQGISSEWTRAVAKDLQQHRGSSLVIAGDEQPAQVHALAHAMNAALANVGKTVYYTDPLESNPVDGIESLGELMNDMKAGKVDVLLILGGNPVYDAPIDFDFGPALLNVKLRVHSGLYYDETGEFCHWHVPATHYLESWGDARAYDGTIGIIQPLIAPLYQGCHSAYEITGLLGSDPGKSNHDIVRDYWAGQRPEKDKAFEDFWERSLHDGILLDTALPATAVAARTDFQKPSDEPAKSANSPDLEISFRPDPAIFDGRFANNGWLQELPKPNTRLTWDNAGMISAATAQRLSLATGDYVKLQLNGRETKAGIMIVPGHAENSITLHLGYGRRRAGKVGTGPGFNANFIRTSAAPWSATGLRVQKTGDTYYFAVTQHQYIIDHEGHGSEEESDAAFHRDLIQVATLDEFRANPNFARDPNEEASRGLTLYPGFKYEGYSWGMSIDLNKCVGCNACVVACQSENNIAVVGKDQVMRGRAMHWIRVDTYFRGGLENPEMYYEPMPCMQCENAPCEVVCPVGATTHSPEGLNEMTYNRCVGTRYCSNNCPYKVRRFNFLLFSDWQTPSLYGVRNPNVTVRSRGVMEKCTYCVQRINAAKIRSEEENRSVHDGEIVTACQGACPSDAIVFGNINDPNSRVAKLKAQSRNYTLLAELNTRPRTTYLARVRNPNPEIHE